MIQALAAAVFAGMVLVSGLIGTQSLRDHFAYRDLNKSTAADLERVNSHHDTQSPNVKEPDFFPPASTQDDATATAVAVSNEPASDTQNSPSGAVLGESIAPAQPVIYYTGVTEGELEARLDALSRSLLASIGSVAHSETQIVYRSVGDVALQATENFVPKTGGTLTEVTVNGVTGLTEADIPDTITASNYLALAGGTLSGDLTMTGTLTAGALSVAGISSSGALIGPYVTATSTTATSTFAGGLQALTSNNSGLTFFQNGLVTVTRNFSSAISDANYETATTLLLKNTSEVSGAQDYQNEVHLTLQAGTSADHRAYINFNDYTGTHRWLTGRNASSVWVLYNSDDVGSGHRMWLEPSDPKYASHSGNSYFNSAGTGIVRINYDLFENNAGTGGLEVWSGGTLAANAAVFKVLGNNGAGGQVAIGTTTPAASAALHIDTSQTAGAQVIFSNKNVVPNTASGKSPAVYVNNFNNTTGLFLQKLSTGSGDYIDVEDSSGNQQFIVKSSGHVGVGNAAPTYKLDVTGLGHFTGLVDAANFVATSTTVASTFGYRVGIGVASPSSQLQIGSTGFAVDNFSAYGELPAGANVGSRSTGLVLVPDFIGTTGATLALGYYNNSTWRSALEVANVNGGFGTLSLMKSGGNVGIGTANPLSKLHAVNTNFDASTNPGFKFYGYQSSSGATVPLFHIQTGWETSGPGTSNVFKVNTYQNDAGFNILASGNVGVGTTDINSQLTVKATGDGDAAIQIKRYDNDNNYQVGLGQRQVIGIGGMLDIFATDGTTVNGNLGPSWLAMTIGSGRTGISTSTPWRTLSVTGTVGFDGLTLNTGAATASLCLSSTNEVTRNTDNESCITSSARYKKNIEALQESAALATLMQLRPVSFEYKNTPGTRYGLIAEEVDAVDTTLVGYDDEDRPNSVRYTSIVPLLIDAVQELAQTLAGFAEKFTTKELVATNGTFTSLTTSKLCVSDDSGTSCYTRSQLDSLLSGSVLGASAQHEDEEAASAPEAGATGTLAANSPSTTSTPAIVNETPTIIINGANSATTTTSSVAVPVNDSPQPEGAEQSHDGNSPAEELPATGTE